MLYGHFAFVVPMRVADDLSCDTMLSATGELFTGSDWC
jgi:hypothetical protein